MLIRPRSGVTETLGPGTGTGSLAPKVGVSFASYAREASAKRFTLWWWW